jgi:hypothetical protein
MAMRAATLGLLMVFVVAAQPRPSDADAAAAVEKSRAVALEYTKSLPDFVCTEIIRRYHDGFAVPADTLTVKLTYFDQKEDHQLIQINNRPTTATYDSLGDAVGIGEFGGMLESIFAPTSHASFRWEKWKTEHNRRAAVYAFAVEARSSQYAMVSRQLTNQRTVFVAYHGEMEIDPDTNSVLRFSYVADGIPRSVGLDSAVTTVEYDQVAVGGRDYWLPVNSQTETHGPRVALKNQVEFRDYRKYSSDSTVTFGTGK